MERFARKFRVAAVAALFALSLLAGAGVTASAQWRDDPYYGGGGKEQRKREKEAEKRRRKEEKEWEKEERKREKEERKARERWGRDGDYDDEGYDDDRYGRRDSNYGYGRGDSEELEREAYERGAREGLRAGESDRAQGRGRDYDRHRTYREASAGYSDRYGSRGEYQESFREGFRRGYDEGYDRGGTYRGGDTGWGRILGDIIGRP